MTSLPPSPAPTAILDPPTSTNPVVPQADIPGYKPQPKALVDVSFIIPVYNEEENVLPLVKEVTATGERLNRSFEIVIIDDGSSDATLKKLRQLCTVYPHLRVVALNRNFGQTPATAAGFAVARGKYFVGLDGDLQNDTTNVPDLVDMLENEELDIISGWRKDRKDNAINRKLPSMIANWLIGVATGVKIHDNGCSLKVYRAEVARQVPLYGEMHRFIPALASIEGARIKEVPVKHRARMHGESKYNISRTFKVVLDLMTVIFMKRFFTRPLHMFGRAGLALFFVASLITVYLGVDKYIFSHDIGTRPMLIFNMLLIMTGVQLISTGLIAEIQVRTYFESQGKAIYKIREIIGG